MHIMIVEDNENLREAISRYLELEAMTVFEFGEVGEASKALEEINPDLIILDVMLPDGDGFLFAKKVREQRQTPIIFLTARTEESDRITGLELGADDYVTKPFSPRELVLRVKAVLKRVDQKAAPEGLRYSLGKQTVTILNAEHRILLNQQEINLTAAEWNILLFLSEKAPQVFSRGQILSACLESIAEGSERTVDTHIKNIRKKLVEDRWIETIRGFGYRFNGENS